MRTRELKCLLTFVASSENRSVLMVTKGSDRTSITAKVFASLYFQRYLLRFLASQTPPFLLCGQSGVGKTWLLRELHKHITALMPALSVFRGNGDELLRALYAATGGTEMDLTPKQLRLVPILPRALALGGVVLLVDEPGSAPWVEPFPGVRIVQVVEKTMPSDHTIQKFQESHKRWEHVHELKGLREEEQFKLAAQHGTPKHPIPLWSLLAKGMKDPPATLIDIVTRTLSRAPRKALQCLSVTRGLTPEEATTCGCTPLTPLLSVGEMVRPSPLLRNLLLTSLSTKALTELKTQQAHRVLARVLLKGGPERRAEAVWHLMRVGSSSPDELATAELPEADAIQLKAVVCDWDVFVHLKKADLMALVTLIPGGSLSIYNDLSGGTAEQQLILGKFLSAAGEFSLARKELAEARDKLRSRARGHACLEIALNEVRYWDSLRNWQSESDLATLIESSRCAVPLLRPANTVERRNVLAKALTSWANASFKAACVSDKWELWLHRAKAATDEVRQLLAGCPPSGVLGRAILVEGVTTTVRAQKLQAAEKPYRAVVATAIRTFQEAERMLVLALGPVNEHSIYTHGNLGELYIYRLADVKNGLLHLYKSCKVGCAFFGARHPNVRPKLKEFAGILRRIGFSQGAASGLVNDAGGFAQYEALLQMFVNRVEIPRVSVEEWVQADEYSTDDDDST